MSEDLDMIKKTAEAHFDLMKLVDQIKIIDALKSALDNPDKTLKALVQINHEARISAWNFGREDAEKIN